MESSPTSHRRRIIQSQQLVQSATAPSSRQQQGRQFWTGGRLLDALEHLKAHPDDVCMARLSKEEAKDHHDYATTASSILVLLGGPIPSDTLVDVTDHDFSYVADSFDVGEMTRMTTQWFQKTHEKQSMCARRFTGAF